MMTERITNKAWRNEDTLRNLYVQAGKTQEEVAAICGCSPSTIRNWLNRFGIETREGGFSTNYVYLRTIPRGYVCWEAKKAEGTQRSIGVHQLLAIAEGADPYKVFSGGEYGVHHKNRIKWDNRPENIEVVSRSDHNRIHHEEDPDFGVPWQDGGPWRDEDTLRKLYVEKRLTKTEIARRLDCSRSTVKNWVRHFGLEDELPTIGGGGR